MISNQIGPMSRKLSRYIKHNLAQRISEITNNQVTHIQGRVMYYIEWNTNEGKDVYQKDIESFLAVSKSTASEIISNLENNGYIERVKLESDARLRKLVLLEKGHEVIRLIGESIKDFENELQNKLSKEELECFIRIIDKLIN